MGRPGGYAGTYLTADLTGGELTEDEFDEALLRSFVGGYGLGARVLYDRIPAGAAPLGPQNWLGIVTGPLTGTSAPLASRYCAMGKSPLTGHWGDANSGGYFGPHMKFAGVDGLFFGGVSEKPVYLLVEDGQSRLLPAEDLWGQDTLETEEALLARHGDDAKVVCIGPAGERQALISCIINDKGRAAGRSGLGAVMGSKRLKAIVVRGDRDVPVADLGRMKELMRKYIPQFKESPNLQIMRDYGTSGYTVGLMEVGRSPIKNWAGAYPDDYPNYAQIDGPALADYEIGKYTCWHCNVACGGTMRWESEGKVYEGHRPEYESIVMLGTVTLIDDAKGLLDVNEYCNRAGLDTISAGSAVGLAMECYEKGLLTRDDLGGMALEWGDAEAAMILLERITAREGIGDLLSQGVARAAATIGHGAEEMAVHSGGQALPAHDPRHEPDFGLVYQVSPTPGRHTQGGVGGANIPDDQALVLGLDLDLRESDPVRFHAEAYAAKMAWRNVVNAAGLCTNTQQFIGMEYVPEFLAAATGWDLDMTEVVRTGERIEDMRMAIGLRDGYNPLETKITARAMGGPPMEGGPRAGVTVDVDALRAAYFQRMAWDPQTGVPSPSRLEELDLGPLVPDLHGGGLGSMLYW